MAGGRRRRSITSGSESALNVPIPLAIVPEDSVSIHEDYESAGLTAGSNRTMTGLEDADDPFAYDSDLETLSSVSSHSSMSSSNGSVLDLALDQTNGTDQQQVDCSEAEDDDDDEMASVQGGGDQDTDEGESGDAEELSAHMDDQYGASAHNNNDEELASDKAESDSEGSGDDKTEARYLSKPGMLSASASTTLLSRPRRTSSTSSKRQSKYATYRLENGEDGDIEDEDADVSDSQGLCSALDTPETCESGIVKSVGSRGSKRKRQSEADADADSEDNSVPQSGAGAGDMGEFGDEEEEVTQGDMDGGEDNVANEARRSEALVELTGIEVEFAKLRERLYSERLQQVQIEEEYLVAGQHMEYERHIEDISASFVEQMERLQATHEVWLAHRQKMHEAWQSTVKYTYLVQRQELRGRLLAAQKKRAWRLRDTRVQDDRRRAERASALPVNGSAAIEDVMVMIAQQQQQANKIRLFKRERLAATVAQKSLVHMRQQRLAVPGFDTDEMDADYLAMNLPVYAREQKEGAFRRLYVPAMLTAEADAAVGKKRKPRQPRQSKKKKLNEDAAPENAAPENAAPENAAPRFPDGVPNGRVNGEAVVRPATALKPVAVPNTHVAKAASSAGVTSKQTTHVVPTAAAAVTAARSGPMLSGVGPAARKAVARPPPLTLPSPHNLHGAGRIQATTLGGRPAVGGSVSTAQPVVVVAAGSGGSASSDDTGARGSVDMHVPTGNGGPLGLRV
ncbi:hypothetical protein GGH94_004906 [Coemansia aciculifera]|uniref:Uncharacterized protein n=1 Tax=Coemansia aciculifera TaxID=417176 RepID=A0A9W8IMI1_9FUNG|nr:hypothetical protein GGH94_004906 [Coemansia aciculifera]